MHVLHHILYISTTDLTALTSLLSGKSEARQDLVFEVLLSLFRIRQIRIEVHFLWVPAHVGVNGNEQVDLLAKKALNHPQIEIKLGLSKAEFKRVISVEVNKKWQKLWNSASKGRHLFQIQEYVGNERKIYGNRKNGGEPFSLVCQTAIKP